MTRQVAIYGGGIIAMLTALCLKQKGFSPELWRPKKNTSEVLKTKRVFALNRASLAFLDQLGVIKPQGTLVKKMFLWDSLNQASLILKASERKQTALAQIIDESLLWQSVYRAFQEHQIPLFEHDPNRLPVLTDGIWHLDDSQTSSMLCIADGANSKLRETLQLDFESDDYRQKGIVAEVVCDRPHQGVAYQVFTPNGPLAFLPLHEEYHYSIVWSLDDALASKNLGLGTMDFLAQLNSQMAGQVGNCIELSERHAFPLKMFHAKHYFAANFLLLGDTAHHFHPLAGLGLNAGIADIICLNQYENPFSFANLSRFQRERKAKLALLIMGMKFLKQGFGCSHPAWVKLRGLGMDFLNHETMLKKWMMSMVDEV
jgi:2-octaprenylphenol hydroxylase